MKKRHTVLIAIISSSLIFVTLLLFGQLTPTSTALSLSISFTPTPPPAELEAADQLTQTPLVPDQLPPEAKSVRHSQAISWTVYTDKYYGYSIKYPSDFYLSPTPADAVYKGGIARVSKYRTNTLFDKGQSDIPINDFFKVEIGIMAKPKLPNQTLSAWLINVIGPTATKQQLFEEVKIDGAPGLKLESTIDNLSGRTIYVAQGEIVYFIFFLFTPSLEHEDIYESISSSIRFYDKQIPEPTSELDLPHLQEPNTTPAQPDFRLPFIGITEISLGPGEYPTHIDKSAEAIDFTLSAGHEVRAVVTGTVIYADYAGSESFGNLILIRHIDGTTSYYAHLSERYIEEGVGVNRGDVIGLSGCTGLCTGDHLHFEVRSGVSSTDIYTGTPVWVRDIPGISWNVENGRDCPPCTNRSGAASSTIASYIDYDIKFQLPSSSEPNRGDERHVKFRLVNTSSPQEPRRYFYSTATATEEGLYSGRVSITNDPDDYNAPGGYYVLVKGPSHLQKGFVIYLHDGANAWNWSNTLLLAGDVTGSGSDRMPDNVLREFDIASILSIYDDFINPVDPGTLQDLTFDNLITMDDISLVLTNFKAITNPGDNWNSFLGQSGIKASSERNNTINQLYFNSPIFRMKSQVTDWMWPLNISQNTGHSSLPAVSVDDQDTIHVVWTDNTSGSDELFYSTRSNSFSWSRPEIIPGTSGGIYPDIAVDGTGAVHISWMAGMNDIYYVYKPDGGEWAAPVNVSNSSTFSFFPAVAVDSHNTSHIVWEEWDSSARPSVFYSTKSAGGSWLNPTNISSGFASASTPDVAIDDDDTIHVVWSANNIFHTQKPRNGSWSTPTDISVIASGRAPAIDVGVSNIIDVVWSASGTIMNAERIGSSDWSSPSVISNTVAGSTPDVTVAGDAIPHVVWIQSDQVFYSKKDDLSGWTTPADISNSAGGAQFPAITADSLGLLHVVWEDATSGNPEIHHTYSIPEEGIVPITLVPDAATVDVGDSFPVDLLFNTQGMPISTIAISLSYTYEGTSPELTVLDADPEQDGVQTTVNQDLSQAGWSYSVNDVKIDPGRVLVNLALSNYETAGYSVLSNTLLARIDFKANGVFFDKAVSFDHIQTKITSKADAVNVLNLPSGGVFSTHGTRVFLPLLMKNVAPPPPGFSLSLSPGAATVVQGQASTYTVNVTAQSDYDSSVSLSVSGLPENTSVAWSANPIIPPSSSVLTVTTGYGTPIGSYALQVTGNGNGLEHTADTVLEVQVGQPVTDGVLLYEHANYGGDYVIFTDSDANLTDDGFNNIASSLQIFGNYQVTLYEHANYVGTSSTFVTSDPDLGDDAIGHNQTSSIQINRAPYVPFNPFPADGDTDQSVNVGLSWTGGDPNGDSVTYNVYLEAADSTPDELVSDNQSSTSYDSGTLSAGTHYYWKIVAIDERGMTTAGPVWDFFTSPINTPTPTSTPTPTPTSTPTNTPTPTSTPTPTPTPTSSGQPPVAPSDLQATPIDPTHIRLDWNDNSDNESGFQIYDGDIYVATVEANSTLYTVGNLAPDSYHCYHIYAFNDYGDSPWTDWACATTPPSIPNAPSDVTIWLDSSTAPYYVIMVSWNDNSDNEDGFNVTVSIAGGASQSDTVPANTTSVSAFVIQCGSTPTSYTVSASISAFNSAGTSDDATAETTLVVPACP